MLREIIAIWKGECFMKKVVEEFAQMLGDAEYVFTNAWGVFIGKLNIDEIKEALYEKDISVKGLDIAKKADKVYLEIFIHGHDSRLRNCLRRRF